MRCHQHLESEAVAVCVSCGRGLCRDCHQTTLDQRTLCGLPQCGEFARRQAAVQFVIGQDFANRATQYQMLVRVLRAISLIVIVPSVLFEIILLVSAAVRPLGAPGDFFVLVVLGVILILLGGVTWRYQSRLSLLQKNCEDLAGEFGRGASEG